MCCYSDPKAKREFLKSLGDRTTFRAWKVVSADGCAAYARPAYRYYPGEHRTTVKRYNLPRPRGFHVYRERQPACDIRCGYRQIPVVGHVADLVRVEQCELYARRPQQAVLTRIRITRKAWKKAGLPNVPRKRGRQ